MRNEKLEAARDFLARAGFSVPDDVILGLMDEIKDKRAAVYEVGDFVYFRMGMGEAGHGKVIAAGATSYTVDVWYPEEIKKTEKPWHTYVGGGDMIGLSNGAEAQEYWDVRSGKK